MGVAVKSEFCFRALDSARTEFTLEAEISAPFGLLGFAASEADKAHKKLLLNTQKYFAEKEMAKNCWI